MKYLFGLVAIVGALLYRNSLARTAPEPKVRQRGKTTLASSIVVLYYCCPSFVTYFGFNFNIDSLIYLLHILLISRANDMTEKLTVSRIMIRRCLLP